MATRTHNGKSKQGGTPTGNDSTRKNQNPSLLETIKLPRQMENLGKTQSTKQKSDHNNNERGGGGNGEKENCSLKRRGPTNMGQEKWRGIQLKRSLELHYRPGPRRPSATVGKDLGQPLVAKNQNVQMASTSQLNSNLGKHKEKRVHRPLTMPPLSS
jgi:hypothetical protein